MDSPKQADPLETCALCQWPEDNLVEGFCSQCRPHVCSSQQANSEKQVG